MDKKFFVLLVSILMLISCGQREEWTFSKHSSANNIYSVEIPSNTTQVISITDLMSFKNTNYNLTITIQQINEGSIDEYIHNKEITNNTFTYNLFQASDSTSFYKITRGNNMWSAYDLYMLKRLDDSNYLIKVNSDLLNRSEMIEMIKHIYTSMKLKVFEKNKVGISSSENRQESSLDKTYSTSLYTIKYPKEWQIQENLNEMTEVYIGNQPDNFGFTIVRFETNHSLPELIKEVNKNVKQAGFRILEEEQMKIDGVKCFKAVQEIDIQEQKVTHISYTFKKDNMLYNIKFGSINTISQKALAAEIVDSFKFKQFTYNE